MSESSLHELVACCVATACGVQRAAVTPTGELRELGLDSLSLVSVAALVEAAGGIALAEDSAARLFEARTVADLIEIFENPAPSS